MKKAALPYKKILLAILALVVSITIGTSAAYTNLGSTGASRQVAQTPTPIPKPATKEELLALVNEERAKVGVAPLTVDPKLEQSAQWKADRMTQTGNLAHIDPSTGRNDGLDYLDTLEPDCSYIGENLRWNVPSDNTAQAALIGWKSSEPHYKAILNGQFVSTGFGISGTNIVEHFCKK
mgnify:CR=1 FL=1